MSRRVDEDWAAERRRLNGEERVDSGLDRFAVWLLLSGERGERGGKRRYTLLDRFAVWLLSRL